MNRRVMQVLFFLQFLCLIGFGHYYKYRRHAGTEFLAVHVLDDRSLPLFLQTHANGSLLYFHSKTCVHCKVLSPAYEAAASELLASSKFPLASADLDAAPVAARQYGVQRVPTVLLLKKTKVMTEMPPTARTTERIVSFVREAMEPAVISFQTLLDLEDAIPQLRSAMHQKAPPVIVGFSTHPNSFEILEFAAEQSRGKTVFLFVAAPSPDSPMLRAYFSSEGKDRDYTGSADPEAVSVWVKGLLAQAKT